MKRMERCVSLLKNHFGALQPEHINRLVVKNYTRPERRMGKRAERSATC